MRPCPGPFPRADERLYVRGPSDDARGPFGGPGAFFRVLVLGEAVHSGGAKIAVDTVGASLWMPCSLHRAHPSRRTPHIPPDVSPRTPTLAYWSAEDCGGRVSNPRAGGLGCGGGAGQRPSPRSPARARPFSTPNPSTWAFPRSKVGQPSTFAETAEADSGLGPRRSKKMQPAPGQL